MKPIVMLDMDGVISDFMCVYSELSPRNDSRSKFREAVMVHHIFELLPKLPNADRLIDLLFNKLDVEVQILSSTGSRDTDVSQEAARQKSLWLEKHGINVKTNFVSSWSLKENFSSSRCIMIDDRSDVINNFIKHGGQGILYEDDLFDSLKHEIENKVAIVRKQLQTKKEPAEIN